MPVEFTPAFSALSALRAEPKILADKTVEKPLGEVIGRLSDVLFLYIQALDFDRIRLQTLRSPQFEGNDQEHLNMQFAVADRVRLSAECAYIISHRLLDLIRWINKRVCGRKKICTEPLGIVRLRNDFIIHPENVPGVIGMGRVTGGNDIVRFHRFHEPDRLDNTSDPGLTENLRDLIEFLVRWTTSFRSEVGLTA